CATAAPHSEGLAATSSSFASHYSYLRATIGSTFAARQEGRNAATHPTLTTQHVASPKLTASSGDNWSHIDFRRRAQKNARTNPAAAPAQLIRRLSRMIIQSTRPRGAPSAMRVPISVVRRLVRYDKVP